jgi:hypothetical protein
MRRLNRDERRAIDALRKLAERWPPRLELFANNGSLLVIIPSDNNRIVAEIPNIRADGGDCAEYSDDDGNEYLDR